MTSGNTYIGLNVSTLKDHIDKKQYYFEAKDELDDVFLKEVYK
ncbi:hypothetical protein [Sporosalibacterium faouarense]|nr:hypothetical protein [Sporosalibacterium faouarense]